MAEEETTLNLNDVPELVKGVNIAKLDLDARAGFVYSQIDGRMTVADLKFVTKLPDKVLFEIIEKLRDEGVVKIEGQARPLSLSRARPVSNNSKSKEPLSLEDKVRKLYMELEGLNHYELLGVKKDAPVGDVKKAFYRMTREFHPDRFFRGEDKEIRERLQAIFAQINLAYKVLSNNKKRHEYDLELKESRVIEVDQGEGKPKKRVIRKPEKKQVKNPFTEHVLKAKRLYESALLEIKRNNFNSARQNIKLAISIDPYNKSYEESLRELDRMETAAQAARYYEDALEHEKHGRHKEATKLYREAMLLDENNPLYYIRLANISLEIDRQPELARKFVKKAMDLDPKNAEAYLVLGKVFRESRQFQAAISQFEKGLELDPSNKELAKELKRAKKGK